MEGTLWALALLALLPCAPPQQRLSRAEQELVEWATERCLPLDSLDADDLDREALAALERELEGVRILCLGEPDHFIHEKNDARLLLLRWLFERGFRHVGMEMGHSDAWRMDRYLAGGQERWLERIALYGYDGDLRGDRRDEVEGWTDRRDEDLARRVDAESRWLLRRLRELNAALEPGSQRLVWFGYDVSFLPGGGYADAELLLAPHRGAALVDELLARLVRVEGESRTEEVARLETLSALLADRRSELARELGDADARELARMVSNLADSLRWIDAAAQPLGSEARAQGLAARERAMMRALDERLEALGPDEKLVLLGHDLHLSRSSEGITLGGQPLWTTVGTHLARRHADQLYVVWMLFDRGVHGNPRASPPIEELASLPGSVESVLAHVGECFLLPLDAGPGPPLWLRRRRSFLRNARGVLPDQADAVLFVRTVRAPQER